MQELDMEYDIMPRLKNDEHTDSWRLYEKGTKGIVI